MSTKTGFLSVTQLTIPVLVISLLFALLALALRYAGAHVPYLFPGYIFETLLVAYAVLLAGVVFRKL